MRRNLTFILFLALLSLVSGWLMSRMSWIGKVGVNLFHREYKFLKVWYEGAGVIFAVLLVLFLVQSWVHRSMARGSAKVVHLILLVVAGFGLYATYQNFRMDITHSVLRERFHLGAYLFWVGWIAISLFFLSQRKGAARLSKR